MSNLRVEMRLGKEERARVDAKKSNLRIIDQSSDDAEEGEEEDDRSHVQPMSDAVRGWKVGEESRRVLSPMFFQRSSTEELGKYIFLQSALEDNLTEYRKLRTRLKEIVFAVKDINSTYFRELRKNAPANASVHRRRSKARQSR